MTEIKGKRLAWLDCSPGEFVRRWSPLASGPGAKLYAHLPKGEHLNKTDLARLYAFWQERTRLGAAERRALTRLNEALPTINVFRARGQPNESQVLDFYEELTHRLGRSLSLKLFALHASLPHVFPAFSADRLAAYQVLSQGQAEPLPVFNEALLPAYFRYQKYFFDVVVASRAEIPDVDRAFLALGKFLARYKELLAD